MSSNPQQRVRKVTRSDGSSFTYGYDQFGNVISVTDPDGVVRGWQWSPGGVLLQRTFADGTTANNGYDSYRRITSLGGARFTYTDGVLSKVDHADGGQTKYPRLGLDPNDFFKPDMVIDGDTVRDLTWDAHGRLKTIDPVTLFDPITTTYDALGRQTRIDRGSEWLELSYDRHGNISEEKTASGSWKQGFTTTGHLQDETYPSGTSLSYAPDATIGMPTAITGIGISQVKWASSISATSWRHASGVTVKRTLDSTLRVTKMEWERDAVEPEDPPVIVASFEVGLTPGGRIAWEKRMPDNTWDVYERKPASQAMRIENFKLSAVDQQGTDARCPGPRVRL